VYLVGACGPQRVTRSEIGLDDLRYLRKGIVKCMMGVLGRYLNRGWFYCHLVSGVGWGVKDCWNSSNFSFRNKFIIVLPCGLLVDNDRFKNVRI
jgi:hypothetical protein